MLLQIVLMLINYINNFILTRNCLFLLQCKKNIAILSSFMISMVTLVYRYNNHILLISLTCISFLFVISNTFQNLMFPNIRKWKKFKMPQIYNCMIYVVKIKLTIMHTYNISIYVICILLSVIFSYIQLLLYIVYILLYIMYIVH